MSRAGFISVIHLEAERAVQQDDEVLKASMEQAEARSANANQPETIADAGEISAELERFSRLSSELAEFLSNISRKVQGWMGRLGGIQSEIDLKKEELQRLHGIEASAAALEKIMEEQRLTRQSFESLMENQRELWEEEQARRLKEEREYFENLRIQRQSEEEAYQRNLQNERQQLRQQLDEELRALHEQSILKLQEREKECARVESMLKEKELELTRLVQELELVMYRTAGRLQSLTVPDSTNPPPPGKD